MNREQVAEELHLKAGFGETGGAGKQLAERPTKTTRKMTFSSTTEVSINFRYTSIGRYQNYKSFKIKKNLQSVQKYGRTINFFNF